MNDEQPRMGDAALSLALRGLRQDVQPSRDLWPGIAARLQANVLEAVPVVRHQHGRWQWPLALAASLMVAVGLAWQLDAPVQRAAWLANAVAQAPSSKSPGSKPPDTLVAREADSLTIHYEAALRQMAPYSVPASWQPGFDALDRSAVEIRSAMEHDPNSRLLLQQLRSTYTRRLALARRALYA